MEGIIFRNDDAGGNSSWMNLTRQYGVIWANCPKSTIISGTTCFYQESKKAESVYEETPFKHRPVDWFYKEAGAMTRRIELPAEGPAHSIASHGLYHVDHTKIGRDAQEMSILGSCSYLGTGMFIPPFNRWNEDTKDICEKNNIELLVGDWKSLEHNDFDPNHKLWYWHSWRWDAKRLTKALTRQTVGK